MILFWNLCCFTTEKLSIRDYFHHLKSPDFRLQLLRCAGSYSGVFTISNNYSFIELKGDLWVLSLSGEQPKGCMIVNKQFSALSLLLCLN